MFFLPLTTLLFVVAAVGAPPTLPMKGFVYTSYSANGFQMANQDAANMASLGIRVVEVMATWYVENTVNATRIFQDPTKSPLDADVVRAIRAVQAAGMSVALKPHIDSLDGVWRAEIGTQFKNASQWDDFFSNYTAFITVGGGPVLETAHRRLRQGQHACFLCYRWASH